jgi:hypothetical protein
MSKNFLKLFIIAALLVTTAYPVLMYAQDNNAKIIEQYTPKLQIESVIEKAKEYALSQGKNLKNYYIKSIKFDADEKEWTIFLWVNYRCLGIFLILQ